MLGETKVHSKAPVFGGRSKPGYSSGPADDPEHWPNQFLPGQQVIEVGHHLQFDGVCRIADGYHKKEALRPQQWRDRLGLDLVLVWPIA